MLMPSNSGCRMRKPTFIRSMGTPEATRRCMVASTRVVSGASERPEATIEAGMSGVSGRLVGSNVSMLAQLIGELRGNFEGATALPHPCVGAPLAQLRYSPRGNLRGDAYEAGCDRAWHRGRGAAWRICADLVRAWRAGPHRAERHDAANRQERPRAVPQRRRFTFSCVAPDRPCPT